MSGKFEPKTKVELDPPKDEEISLDYLAKCDGMYIDERRGKEFNGSVVWGLICCG